MRGLVQGHRAPSPRCALPDSVSGCFWATGRSGQEGSLRTLNQPTGQCQPQGSRAPNSKPQIRKKRAPIPCLPEPCSHLGPWQGFASKARRLITPTSSRLKTRKASKWKHPAGQASWWGVTASQRLTRHTCSATPAVRCSNAAQMLAGTCQSQRTPPPQPPLPEDR